MADALRTLTFTRKASLLAGSVFEAGLHTDAALEALVEGTRNTVLAWVGLWLQSWPGLRCTAWTCWPCCRRS